MRDEQVEAALVRLINLDQPDITVNEMLAALGMFVSLIIREAGESDERRVAKAEAFAEALTTSVDPTKRAAFFRAQADNNLGRLS